MMPDGRRETSLRSRRQESMARATPAGISASGMAGEPPAGAGALVPTPEPPSGRTGSGLPPERWAARIVPAVMPPATGSNAEDQADIPITERLTGPMTSVLPAAADRRCGPAARW